MLIYIVLAVAAIGFVSIGFLVWQSFVLQKRIDNYQTAIIEAQGQLTENFNESLEVLADGNEAKIIEKQRVIERIKPVEAKISFNHRDILRRTFDRLFYNSNRPKNADITETNNTGIYAER